MTKTFRKFRSGFTLIELIIVIAILAVLFLGLLVTFNPLTQYNKAKDAIREHDLQQTRQALDAYLNDFNCYPASITLNAKWQVNSTVYIQQIPQDPDNN